MEKIELPPSFNEDGSVNDAYKSVHQVNLSDLTPMNDPNCVHEFVKDPTDENENYYAETCTKCPVGRLVSKHK